MVLEEISEKKITELLLKNTMNVNNNMILPMPYPLEYEKYNPEHVLLINGFIQVMVGSSLYSKYINSSPTLGDSIQFFFANSISIIEFFSMPMVHQLMSVFQVVRPIGFERTINGIWANEPFPNTVETYKNLLSQGKIDPCMEVLFKAKGRRLTGHDVANLHKTYEIKQEAMNEDNEEVEQRLIKNKFLMYMMTTSMGYQKMCVFLLYGWTQEEICNCEYINDLKFIFERVFVLGSGEPWVSTQIVAINPKNNLFYNTTKVTSTSSIT